MSKLVVTTIEDASGASGTVTFTGSVQAVDFNSTSDARLKNDINTIQGGLDKVSQMRGVTFKIHEKPSAGVVAQEMEKIILIKVPTEIYSELRQVFVFLFENSGFKDVKINEAVDFEKLYKLRKVQ